MLEGCEEVTSEYLDSKKIPYNELYYGVLDKRKFCIEHNIDIFIDDSVKHIKDISSIGIPTILFESELNKKCNIKVLISNDWLDVERIINSIKK